MTSPAIENPNVGLLFFWGPRFIEPFEPPVSTPLKFYDNLYIDIEVALFVCVCVYVCVLLQNE